MPFRFFPGRALEQGCGWGKGNAMQEQAGVADADYKVLVNHEEQYALCPIGPVERVNPSGWRDAGFRGSREACLNYINEIWVDMRPASLRKRLAECSSLSSSGSSATATAAAAPRKPSAKARR